MRGLMGYMLISMLPVLAMGLATVSGLGLAVGARPVSERGAVIQHVDRTHKGDRLEMRTTFGTQPVPEQDKAVLVGCEPAFSSLSIGNPSISGRCVS